MNEKLIADYMKKLDISREEAIQLIEDDAEDFIGDEGEEMQKKAKAVKRYEKSAEPKEKKPRPKKIDEDKVLLVASIFGNLDFVDNPTIVNNQREITFTYNGGSYSLTLTKHRPKK